MSHVFGSEEWYSLYKLTCEDSGGRLWQPRKGCVNPNNIVQVRNTSNKHKDHNCQIKLTQAFVYQQKSLFIFSTNGKLLTYRGIVWSVQLLKEPGFSVEIFLNCLANN